MLWSLISSAFVIYLYRTLNAEAGGGAGSGAGQPPANALDAEIRKLNERIDLLEGKASKMEASL